MNKRILNLLGETDKSVEKILKELESRNGYPSHDVRFYADTHQQVRQKLTELGLDANDTTAEELFHALQVKFEKDARIYEEKNGSLNDFDSRAAKASMIIAKNKSLPQQWSLKSSEARRILKSHPPKQMMKMFGYRSVDSMLKRENIARIFLIAKNTESANWHNIIYRSISKLDQAALELRQLKIVTLPSYELSDIESEDSVILADEVAAMGFWPTDENSKAPLISMVLILSEALARLSSQKSNTSEVLDDSVAWWADMEHLLTDINGEKLSLNIHDVAESHLNNHSYSERVFHRSKNHYWQNLIERYENHPQLEAVFDNSALQRIRRLKFNAPEPAYEFEYVDDI